MSKNNGFTLIELLVVIAIIGVLASVILTSLNSSRGKGYDAKVKSQLVSLRTRAELYRAGAGNFGISVAGSEAAISPNFGNGCSTGMFTDVALDPYTATTAYPPSTSMRCTSSGSAYAVSASLNSNNPAASDHWCVDSTGTSKAIGALHNSSTYVCPSS